jgi:uroporphyrinogen-III decarboxylase
MRWETILDTPVRRQTLLTITTPRGELTHITEERHWQATTWHIKEAVRSVEELEMLASVPFDLDTEAIDEARAGFLRVRARYGDTHALKGWVSSPMVCISGCMPLELFLELSYTHREWFLELCNEITNRILAVCERLFSDDIEWTDVVMAMGGSEQCTPPLMHPRSFDELVVPFDSRIIDFLKSRGMLIQNHCHGKVKHALQCMVRMGVDASDPVEPPPAGDVTFGEAQEVTDGRLTLMGNLELDMLEYGTPDKIRAHVKDMFKNGNRRIVVGTSAGPMMPVSRRLVDNYKALFDAALEYGG